MEPESVTFFDILSQGTFGFFAFALVILIFVLAVLWIILPFAVFKIKSLLGDTNIQLMRVNNYLMSIENQLKALVKESRRTSETGSAHPHPLNEIAVSDDSQRASEAETDTDSAPETPLPPFEADDALNDPGDDSELG